MNAERNLLIEAGAGTGKTTRLVKEILRALFIRQIPLEGVVALTFTNKAAGELKERVGQALDDVLSAQTIDALKAKPWWPTPAPVHTLTDLKKLATDATSVLDRANISTIHSFAFSLLKRFPLAAGIAPNAEIDDKGLRFEELFRREWPLWLMEELGDAPPREALWMELLSKLALSEVEDAARALADFRVPLENLEPAKNQFAPRLKELHAEIQALSAAHPGSQKADEVARACEEIIATTCHPDESRDPEQRLDPGFRRGDDLREAINQSLAPTKAWPSDEIRQLKLFQLIAKNILTGGDRVIAQLTESLAPFVSRFRQVLLTEGCLTHSALLYLSREIVKRDREIRSALKNQVQLILIDEFQDTDPLQAELLLYLAEKKDRHAADWEAVQLEPGKLFIVGDPKQSIYRFRGADIAAYERIGKLVVAQGGFQETLEVNYRSQSQVIHLVNRAFERIILPEPEISPPYVSVQPHHPRAPEHSVQDVDIWLADSTDPQSVEQAQATEAEAVALWIKEAVKSSLSVRSTSDLGRRTISYKDVALIFRSYSPMDRFIEALRRHDIPFAVESERYFFTTPEVTDFVTLLRAASDPEDLLSLVGYLRGPMGGLTDQEILVRKNAGTLTYTPSLSMGERRDGGEAPPTHTLPHKGGADSFKLLADLHERLGREPLPEVLQYVFENTFILELAARSYHGDQTVANLLKLRRLLEHFAAEGVTTMGLLLEMLEEFFNDDKIEGESPLADETYNAVRLLTIHKAKGLEYPVVFLPSLHSELKAHKAESFVYDWRSRTMGLSAAGFSNLDKLLLDEQTRRREAAEENRILYVAMTRARERLILSGGIHLKSNKKKSYLMRLLEAWDLSLDNLGTDRVTVGEHSIAVRRLEQVSGSAGGTREEREDPLKKVDLKEFARVWKEREGKRELAENTLLVLNPTGGKKGGKRTGGIEQVDDAPVLTTRSYHPFLPPVDTTRLRLGTLLHLFLEKWDFTCEKCSMPAMLTRLANSFFAREGLLVRPLPDPKVASPRAALAPLPMGEGGRSPGEGSDPMAEVVAIVEEAQKILADFIDSEAYDEIKGAEILGREVPFFYQEGPSLMRGTMDVLYKLPSGQLVIGDYKSGLRTSDVGRFDAQAAAYQKALKRALSVDATFKIISLREEATATR